MCDETGCKQIEAPSSLEALANIFVYFPAIVFLELGAKFRYLLRVQEMKKSGLIVREKCKLRRLVDKVVGKVWSKAKHTFQQLHFFRTVMQKNTPETKRSNHPSIIKDRAISKTDFIGYSAHLGSLDRNFESEGLDAFC